MELSKGGHLVVETGEPSVKVVRFSTPDLRGEIYQEPLEECVLFRELQETVLTRLMAGEILILNLGLVEPFPSRFYSVLIAVKKAVQARQARLLLCCLGQPAQECFTLYTGYQTFTVTTTEAEAKREAGQGFSPGPAR
jgi:hypothetical protein